MKKIMYLAVILFTLGFSSCTKEVDKTGSTTEEFVVLDHEWTAGYYNCTLDGNSEDNASVTRINYVSVYLGSPYYVSADLTEGSDYTLSDNTVKVIAGGDIDCIVTITINYDYSYTVME